MIMIKTNNLLPKTIFKKVIIPVTICQNYQAPQAHILCYETIPSTMLSLAVIKKEKKKNFKNEP